DVHGPGARAGLAADDDPVDAVELALAAAARVDVGGGEAVAAFAAHDADGLLQVDGAEEGLAGQEADGGRGVEQDGDAGVGPLLVLDGDADPDVGRGDGAGAGVAGGRAVALALVGVVGPL